MNTRPILTGTSFINKFRRAYCACLFKLSWNKFITIFLVSAILVFFTLTKIFPPFLSVVITIGIFGGIIIQILRKSAGQKEKMISLMPSFLLALSNALEAGYSLENAFYFIENEIDEPLKNEIRSLTAKLKINIDINKALKEFAENAHDPEIRFFAESAMIQMKAGGNLIELFKKTAGIIDKRIRLKRDIRTFTSQGKISGIIVCSIWFISLFIFWLIFPEHIECLFKTPAGQSMLAVSLLLELTGFFFVWRIINVKF